MSSPIDVHFFRVLADSYQRLLDKSLVPAGMSTSEAARWLYEEAPFGILAHGVAVDPVFVYGNKRAQAIFGYDWDELTALPSRFSAEPMERSERQSFLEKVARDGFVSGYRGYASRNRAHASGSITRRCGNSPIPPRITAVRQR